MADTRGASRNDRYDVRSTGTFQIATDQDGGRITVQIKRWADIRLPALAQVPAAVRFASCEPLLGPLDLQPWLGVGLDWVIVGGESGPRHRPLDLDWVRSVRDQCEQLKTAFFFKQVGGRTPKSGGRLLDGRTWDEYPDGVRHG
jgi:protein gp37